MPEDKAFFTSNNSCGIVPTVAFSTHTLLHLHDIQVLTILIACILAPSIRVMQYTGRWFSSPKSHLNDGI
jgi:hypothetical protein